MSDHLDGEALENQISIENRGLSDVLRWQFSRDAVSWDGYEPVLTESEVRERVAGDELRVTFVGRAMVLIQVAGRNLLTDTVWSERVSPVSWAGPKRFAPPGLSTGGRATRWPAASRLRVCPHSTSPAAALPTGRRLFREGSLSRRRRADLLRRRRSGDSAGRARRCVPGIRRRPPAVLDTRCGRGARRALPLCRTVILAESRAAQVE